MNQITNDQKGQIQQAAHEYMAIKSMSMNDLAAHSKVNISYLSFILRGQYIVSERVGQPGTPISDKWFKMLAEAIEYKLTKQYWAVEKTKQFKEIMPLLEDAKKHSRSGAIIGDTGTGKTYAVDRFCAAHPMTTVRITVSNVHTLSDIIEEIMKRLRMPAKGTKASRMQYIIEELRRRRMNGEEMQVIIDEAENIKSRQVFGLFKALYDGLKDVCALTLIGTPELVEKMEKLKNKNRDGMPQFYRRFKAGIRHISPVDTSFELFLNKYVPNDKGLQKLLRQLCDNYGELNDYLEPALREADRLQQPLTEHLFRLIYNMPK